MSAPRHDDAPGSLAWKSRVELMAIIGALRAQVDDLSDRLASRAPLVVVPDAEAASPPARDGGDVERTPVPGDAEPTPVPGDDEGTPALADVERTPAVPISCSPWADELDESSVYDCGPLGVVSGPVDLDEVDLDQAMAAPPRGEYRYLGIDGRPIPIRWQP